MLKTPVLVYSDFQKEFVVETDACNVGIGAVFSQESNSINCKLMRRMKEVSNYVKEMFDIFHVVGKLRHYLFHKYFTIRTYHKTLKRFLSQIIQTHEQQNLLIQMIGIQLVNYTIEYKPRKENNVTDALSNDRGRSRI